jgi:hypothetical protein
MANIDVDRFARLQNAQIKRVSPNNRVRQQEARGRRNGRECIVAFKCDPAVLLTTPSTSGQFGVIWKYVGTSLGPSGYILGPSWAHPWHTKGLLAPSVGPCWAQLGRRWVHLGPFGSCWISFNTMLGPFWVLLNQFYWYTCQIIRSNCY